jgi:hypothetical protein
MKAARHSLRQFEANSCAQHNTNKRYRDDITPIPLKREEEIAYMNEDDMSQKTGADFATPIIHG